MGVADRAQVCSSAVILARSRPLTCLNVGYEDTRPPVCSVRDEEAAGSNPATPTTKGQITALSVSVGSDSRSQCPIWERDGSRSCSTVDEAVGVEGWVAQVLAAGL
jgi:hypothetical protein